MNLRMILFNLLYLVIKVVFIIGKVDIVIIKNYIILKNSGVKRVLIFVSCFLWELL